MTQSPEYIEWSNHRRPDISEDAERGTLLKEFSRGRRHPSVYLIWERESGKIEKVGIVCICSTRALAEMRVRSMNRNSFWEGTDFVRPTHYIIEECEIDHLFAAEMLGYDVELDKAWESMTASHIYYQLSEEGRIERLRDSAKNQVEAAKAETEKMRKERDAALNALQRAGLRAESEAQDGDSFK